MSSLSLDTFIQNLKKNPNKDYAKMYNFTKEGANAVVDELKAIGVNVSELTGVVMMGGGNGASKTDGATAETEENIELSPEIVILLLAISNINQKFEISSDIQDYYIETIKTLYKINDIMETINTGNLKSIKKTAEVAAAAEKAAAEPGGEAKSAASAETCINTSCSPECDDEETVTEYVTKLQTDLDDRSLLEADEQLPENVSVEIRNIQNELKIQISTLKQQDIRKYMIPGWTPVQKSSEFQEIYSERDFRAYDKCVKIGTETCMKLGGYKGRRRRLKTVVGFNSWSGDYCVKCYQQQFSKRVRDSMEKNTKQGLNEARDIIMANLFKQMTLSEDTEMTPAESGEAKSDSNRGSIIPFLVPGQIPGQSIFQQPPSEQLSARPDESKEDINRTNIEELQSPLDASAMRLQQTPPSQEEDVQRRPGPAVLHQHRGHHLL